MTALAVRVLITYAAVVGLGVIPAVLLSPTPLQNKLRDLAMLLLPLIAWAAGLTWRSRMTISAVGGIPTATLTNVLFEPLVVAVIVVTAFTPQFAFPGDHASSRARWTLALILTTAAALLVGLLFPSLPE